LEFISLLAYTSAKLLSNDYLMYVNQARPYAALLFVARLGIGAGLALTYGKTNTKIKLGH